MSSTENIIGFRHFEAKVVLLAEMARVRQPAAIGAREASKEHTSRTRGSPRREAADEEEEPLQRDAEEGRRRPVVMRREEKEEKRESKASSQPEREKFEGQRSSWQGGQLADQPSTVAA
jgi:hypothetical protein